MKLKIYLKQAWRMMLANKLFSAIYIGGTALAIATTTLFAVTYYVRIAPVYPESNRQQTYYFNRVRVDSKQGWSSEGALKYDIVKDKLYNLKNAEVVSATHEEWSPRNYIQLGDGNGEMKVDAKFTDAAFFQIYPYEFQNGRAFSDEEFQNGIPSVVITDRLATTLFGSPAEAPGKEVSMNYQKFKVVGVVRGASSLMDKAYADIFVPYTLSPGYDRVGYAESFLGAMTVTILADDYEALKGEIDEIARLYNTSQEDETVSFFSAPQPHVSWVFDPNATEGFSWGRIIRVNLLILLVLLLVPAMNLGGLISSRMEMRSSEIGVSRAFGGTRRGILSQVLWENMFLTLAGGLLGLAVVWLSLILTSGSLLTLIGDNHSTVVNQTITPEILFSPGVFIIALVLCTLLNLMSALIPAWFSLRRPIVETMK